MIWLYHKTHTCVDGSDMLKDEGVKAIKGLLPCDEDEMTGNGVGDVVLGTWCES
jgi:hypothetical protein